MVQDLLAKMLGNITACWACWSSSRELQDADVLPGRALRRWPRRSSPRGCARWWRWCREIFGGNGIVLDYDIARFFADAEAIYSFEGTREMNTLIVGKAVTGESAFI